MQESALCRRIMHFLEGQMGWECPTMYRGRGEFNNDSPFFKPRLRANLQTFHRAFQGSYYWLDDSDDEDVKNSRAEKPEHHNKEVAKSENIDLRSHAQRTDAPPIPVERETARPALEGILAKAVHYTIYHIWYEAVSKCSDRRLTFTLDKLPALAGIASRVHDITKDDYLAGHWRRELERSLLWRVETGMNSGHPSWSTQYRAGAGAGRVWMRALRSNTLISITILRLRSRS
jgi:hypothetical protein